MATNLLGACIYGEVSTFSLVREGIIRYMRSKPHKFMRLVLGDDFEFTDAEEEKQRELETAYENHL